MAGENSTTMDYGLPPRLPTASTSLWTHLLRANTSSETPRSLKDMAITAPPMAPLDKNATSMRILLHDTQANFEKFTSHVGKVLDNIQETKHELTTMHKLFERDREGLMGDIVDLVNRSQKEIQKSLGIPAQTAAVEPLFKDVNHRLQGLDQRLDAIQAFNQTHSQALQTQIQAVQILLDKQGSIITAVLPLLPLLQALPLHVDAAKNDISNKLGELSVSVVQQNNLKASSPSHSRAIFEKAPGLSSDKTTGKRKRSLNEHELIPSSPSSTAPVGSLATASLKKPRTKASNTLKDPDPSDNSPVIARQPSVASIPSRVASPTPVVRKNTIGTSYPLATGFSPDLDRAVKPATFSPVSGSPSGSGSKITKFDSLTSGFRTPRRPLSDLPVDVPIPPRRTPSGAGFSSLPGASGPGSVAGMPLRSATIRSLNKQPAQQSSPSAFFGITPTAARPPRVLRVHASIAAISRRASSAQRDAGGPAMSIASKVDILPADSLAPDGSSFLAGKTSRSHTARDQGLQNKAANIVADLGNVKLPLPPVPRVTRSNTRAQTPVAQVLDLRQVATASASGNLSDIKRNQELKILGQIMNPTTRDSSVAPSESGNERVKTVSHTDVSSKQKERRSPVREGRRFIPLTDSESEDDEEDA